MLMGLGDYIRKRRKAKGMTQEDFASKVKRAGSTVSQWETEVEPVPIDMLNEIAMALDEPTPVHLYELAGILSGLPGHKIVKIMAGMSVEDMKRFEEMVEALAEAYVKKQK